MTRKPRPGFFCIFLPRPGFVCIDNAKFRVDEALVAAAEVRGQDGVKEAKVLADVVALCLKPNHAIIFEHEQKIPANRAGGEFW